VIYPDNLEQKIEFHTIRHWLKEKCLSEMGHSFCEKFKMVTNHALLQKILLQVKEFKSLLEFDRPFPSDHYHPLQPLLRKASVDGMFLLENELQQLRQVLDTINKLLRYFDERLGQYPQLEQVMEGVVFINHLVKEIDKILDEHGKLRSNASPEYARLNAAMHQLETQIRSKMERLAEKASAEGWMADTGITIRDGRLVLPILAEFKRQIPGFVHDESNTGQTVYLEPGSVFEWNNELREMQFAHRREKERILAEITRYVHAEHESLEAYHKLLGIIDFIRAKASLAMEMNATMPALSKEALVRMVNAKHPVLMRKHALPVVPLSITLDKSKEQRIVVISGPNAGGKSVCLKTVGLLQYMLQCGLLIPCSEDSECGIFSEIFVDIGDEQSIENDLSTYSSHLKHMKHFTSFAGSKTLFLIDEFGTGTDPQFGGPLAEAILQALNRKKAFGVVTTHYSNLKHYAGNTQGIVNASMIFNHEHMKPTFVLETGKPGSSYAFEIAHKAGISKEIIDYAKDKVGDKQRRLDDLLIEMEKDKKEISDIKKELQQRNEKLTINTSELQRQKQELENTKKEIIRQARTEALSIISEANSKIESVIREVKEKQTQTDNIRMMRKELKENAVSLKESIDKELAVVVKNKSATLVSDETELKQGSHVTLEGQQTTGEVLEMQGKKALVAFGDVRIWVEVKKLKAAVVATTATIKKSSGIDLNAKLRDFSTDLNLVGIRGEEAQRMLKMYIDDAYLLGFKQVRIVHGKGYGILRQLVRDYLKSTPMVHSFTDEHIDMGGDGITLVTMNVG
jgi:DNA mismatch repair protein MutS2